MGVGKAFAVQLAAVGVEPGFRAAATRIGVRSSFRAWFTYASDDYVKRLEQCSVLISMSRPTRPWANARRESFVKTLKQEEIQVGEYHTMEELKLHIEEFINAYYNKERQHSALTYLSPEDFENQHELELQKKMPSLPLALSFRKHKGIYSDAKPH